MAFSFYRTVTIDHTKVPNTDQANFPVLISGTYAYLATVANGGDVTNASGFDIGFYSDAALTTKLDWEIELYTATSGLVCYWVRVPSVSHTTDTVIYLAYANSSISTDQSNKTGVWDSNFKGVYHFGTPASLSVADSTSNAHNGTNANVTASTGQICGAGSFNGTTAGIDLGSVADFTFGTGSFTIEAWFKTSSAAFQEIVAKDVAGNRQWQTEVNGVTAGKFEFGNPVSILTSGATKSYTSGAWNYSVGIRRTSTLEAYLDGAIGTNGSDPTGNYNTNSKVYIGQREFVGFNNWFSGQIDEVRISNSARSADWVTTCYNTQNSPSTFYALGAAVPVGSASPSGTGWIFG